MFIAITVFHGALCLLGSKINTMEAVIYFLEPIHGGILGYIMDITLL